MTRREERIKYIQSFNGKDIENEELKDIVRIAILDGAIWADKTMIDRVCKWLQNHGRDYAIYDDDKIMPSMRSYVDIKKLIKDLRNAMKD